MCHFDNVIVPNVGKKTGRSSMRPSVVLSALFCTMFLLARSQAAGEDSPLFDRATHDPFHNIEHFQVDSSNYPKWSLVLEGLPKQCFLRVAREGYDGYWRYRWTAIVLRVSLEITGTQLLIHLQLRDVDVEWHKVDQCRGILREHESDRECFKERTETFYVTVFGIEQ
jgi:hypothetical protein